MNNFSGTQEFDGIRNLRYIADYSENIVISRTGFFALARPCKYNIYKNIEGKADIPPFQCINSDVQK